MSLEELKWYLDESHIGLQVVEAKPLHHFYQTVAS